MRLLRQNQFIKYINQINHFQFYLMKIMIPDFSIDDHNHNLKYNIVVAATAEEESSGPLGLNSLLVDLPKLDIAIVGEPTEMKLAIAEPLSTMLISI